MLADETQLLRASPLPTGDHSACRLALLRFTSSCRDVEDLLAERRLEVSNESICRWILKFGSAIAKNLSSIRPRPDDHWQLDEIVVSTGGQGIVTLAEYNRF
jgi:transposase-like protein